MRMSRRMGLLGSRVPLANLFGTIRSMVYGGNNGTSTAVTWPDFATEGRLNQTWYAFYSCGSSLEITKISVHNDYTITTEQLLSTAATDADKKTLIINGNSISTANTYANTLLIYRFYNTFSISAIDNTLRNCNVEILKYYGPSSTKATNAQVRMSSSAISGGGVIYAAFNNQGSANTTWSFAKTETPLIVIEGAIGSSWMSRAAYYLNANDYYVPTLDGETNCATSLNGYSLFRLY